MTDAPPPRTGADRFPPTGLARAAVPIGSVAIAAALVVGGVAAIGARAGDRDVPDPAPATPVATVEVLRESSYPVTRGYAARLEPARRSDLAFETGGTLVEVRVDEGDEVARGDVVARLDVRELEAERARLGAARRALDADAELARLGSNASAGCASGGSRRTSRSTTPGSRSSGSPPARPRPTPPSRSSTCASTRRACGRRSTPPSAVAPSTRARRCRRG